MDEEEPPLGVVPVDRRGSLPYALVHGESLVAAASWALTTAGIELFDFGTSFEAVRASGRTLVVHDPLCPLTPTGFLEEAVALSTQTGAVVVGVRPVTDTVKELVPATGSAPDSLGATHPRDELVCVASPVVLPAAVVAELDGLDLGDLAEVVAALARRFPVRHLEAPALARRVASAGDLEVLTALSAAGDARR